MERSLFRTHPNHRHSREGGNPENAAAARIATLDSRLRGNDGGWGILGPTWDFWTGKLLVIALPALLLALGLCLGAVAEDADPAALQKELEDAAASLQDLPPAERRAKAAEMMVTRLDTELELSDAQVEQLVPLLTEHLEKLAALRGDEQETGFRAFRKMRAEAEKLREANDAKIAAILTPDQMTEFKRIRTELQSMMRQQMMAGSAGHGWAGMLRQPETKPEAQP